MSKKVTTYKLIHELLTYVEQFEDEYDSKEGTVDEFAGFLLTQLQQKPQAGASGDVRFGKEEQGAQEIAFTIENAIGRLLIYMSRYAKFYIKKALEGTPLATGEEFTCLAILLTHDELSKKDLIERNMQEKTSGMEVIKRLIAAGLIQQKDDTEDKRSKKVSITPAGRELLFQVFKEMTFVGTIVSGRLTMPEKLVLHHLLQKLDDFHHDILTEKSVSEKTALEKWARILAQEARQ